MNFKTRIREVERKIARIIKDRDSAVKKEERSRKRWTKEYHSFLKSVKQFAGLKAFGTKKHAALKAKLEKGWDARSSELTRERNAFRKIIATAQEDLSALGAEQARLKEEQTGDVRIVDEIVTQVFEFNETVVRASRDREDCLNRHVFPRLIGDDGKLCSQISFTSSDGLRRVIAMVNTMTIVQGDAAQQAKEAISRFFDRFQQPSSMDVHTQALYELTRQILVEKTSFKVGPDLYRFLAMELDEGIFPELSSAQKLLRQSIRSEKTNSYIRIYERSSHADKWIDVRQS